MRTGLLVFVISTLAAAPTHAFAAKLYDGVQFYRFESGVDLPPDFQIRMIEELIHVFQQMDKTMDVYREGEALPQGKRVVRITGIVSGFAPGSPIKGTLLGGVGIGNAKINISTTFSDASSGKILSQHDFGVGGWTGGPTVNESMRFLCEAVARYAQKRSYIHESQQ
jgi:hypothetical protein